MAQVRQLNKENPPWHIIPLFLAGLALFLLRKPLRILWQPGRVEDVDVLISGALHHGWQSLFLVYNYYFHFVPRTVTLLSLYLLGPAAVNLGMNVAAIVIATLCAFFFAKRQFRFIIRDDRMRVACCLFIILVPGIDEVYSNISAIQWFLNVFVMLLAALLLFRYDLYASKPSWSKALYSFLLSASVMSSAFSLVFLPVFGYVAAREARRKDRSLPALSSLLLPTALMAFEAATLYAQFSHQFRTSSLGVSSGVLLPAVNAFAISATKIFYHDTTVVFDRLGYLMYLVPVGLVAFVMLGSARKKARFEIFALLSILATLFMSAAVRRQMLDWSCLCGQAEERYFFLAVVFGFILVLRQFDGRRSAISVGALAALGLVVAFNVSSGFLIQTSADTNWEHVASLYDPSGHYHCYVGEVPHGWQVMFPCSNPDSNSTAMAPASPSGPAVTFEPPVLQTETDLHAVPPEAISGIPISLVATVLPAPEGGTVNFAIDGKDKGVEAQVIGGRASTTVTIRSAGIHNITASFGGQPGFVQSTSRPLAMRVLAISYLRQADLAGADLGSADLAGLDLGDANLSGATLRGVSLAGADLQGADLRRADASLADLRGSDMRGASLAGADLHDSDLAGARLGGADLSGAILSGANLTGTDLSGASLQGANLEGAIMNGCRGCP